MYPEVEQYAKAISEASRAAGEALSAARKLYEEEARTAGGWSAAASGQYAEVRRAAHSEQARATDDARKVLATNASEPLVKWIAENTLKSYEGPSLLILEALPADLATLDAIAVDEDWCVMWDEFREEALEAGALEGVKPLPERMAVNTYIREWAELSRARRAQLARLLDALEVAAGAKAASGE